MTSIEGQPRGRRLTDDALGRLARRYGDALRAGDRLAAEAVVEEALAAGVAPAIVQVRVVQPAMTRIGELWENGAVTVADEHLASAITQQILVRLYDALTVARPRSRERVLLAAVQNQHHVLGLRMVADVLEGAGFDVLFLGADVPVDALRRFAAEHQPAVTGLSFGIAIDVGCLAESIWAVQDACPGSRIMLGGRAVPPGFERAGFPCVRSSAEALATVERLLAGPPQPPSPVVEALRPRPQRPTLPRPKSIDGDPLAERLAGAAAEASDVAREYVRLAAAYRDLALRDPVTGLANRRAFDDRLYADTHAGGAPEALLMIDVDRFKAVNDTHGHEAGDRLLRSIAAAIAEAIRPGDFAARIGGDEFAVLLPGATADTARRIGERVRRAVAEGADPPVTISIGVSPVGEDGRAAVLAADSALYEAKAAGRDRVVQGAGPPSDRTSGNTAHPGEA